jgi:hypothetical protein
MIQKIERSSTSLHCLDNVFWKRLWTRRNIDYEMGDERINK